MMSKKLTGKQQAFIYEYMKDFNQTRAAQRAGYKGNENTLASIGSKNMRHPLIYRELKQMFLDRIMTGEEALMHLTNQARASLTDFLSTGEDGLLFVDLEKARENKLLGSVERLKIVEEVNKDGKINRRTEIKLYDAQKALIEILRVYLRLGKTLKKEPLTGTYFPYKQEEEHMKARWLEYRNQIISAVDQELNPSG